MYKDYLATTLPGIGEIARSYLVQKFSNKTQIKEIMHLRGNDIILFGFDDSVQDLLKPSMIEDVFALISKVKLAGHRGDLDELKKSISRSPIAHDQRRHSVRVVVQAPDSKWRNYRRIDIKSAIEMGLLQSRANKLVVVAEDAEYEIWAQQVDRLLLLSLRLTDKTMRHREYKVANYPGSLRPTVANAMVYLSNPKDEDVFLDPMCGAGTILIERALSHTGINFCLVLI